MAHTTTATTTYALLKYSRSYPTNLQQNASSEWQHFTNPAIRLVLDVTKANNLELRNVRLRVIWTIQSGTIATANSNAEILLEDLDLLAFSSLPAHQGTPMNIPLKAVYRDRTIGVRYLHPLDETNTTVFRRFQVSFGTEQDTNAFVNSIRTVCPCKMSPSQQSQLRQMAGTVKSSNNFPAQHSQSLGPPSAQTQSQYMLEPSDVQPDVTTPRNPMNSFKSPTHTSAQPQTPKWPIMLPPLAPVQRTSNPFIPQQAADVNTQDIDSTSTEQNNDSSQHYPLTSSPQVAAPTPPTNGTKPHVPVESALPSQNRQTEITHKIFSSLKEATSIYDLPPGDLERIVGDIIREDGFTSLLEKLNQLWRVKSLVNL